MNIEQYGKNMNARVQNVFVHLHFTRCSLGFPLTGAALLLLLQ